MADLLLQIQQLMLANRRTTDKHQYTVPSPDAYPYQWLWDSCFHAIILSYYSLEDAKKELESLIARQFKNGMIPHMIYWQKAINTTFPDIDWGTHQTSSITQPPMLAYAVWEIYQKDHDLKFLNKMYQPMKRFYKYLLTERDPRANHLIGIINPDESGEDNSPRFDIPLGLNEIQTQEENFQQRLHLIAKNHSCNFDAPYCMKNFFWVKDVPLNAIMIENLKILSLIAAELNYFEDAQEYHHQALLIKQAMRSKMLEDGIFWSTYNQDYEKIKVITWAIFAPLFAEVATQKEADYLVEKYLKNDQYFKLPYLVPTTAKSEASFDANGFWRGPVWIATNWFVYKGLQKYGYHKEAQAILDSSLELIEKSGFREQYDPFTGEGYGAKNFTWGGLVIDMVPITELVRT